jgi:hypothetical protein
MGWRIKCTDTNCNQQTRASDIVDLKSNHRNSDGWFLCRCGKHGYIEKSFDLQEPGEVWKPFLHGLIPLGKDGDSYQPFVFLVSDEATVKVTAYWFSYYKDLRESGGRLKLGYGPGGPPVLDKQQFLYLLQQLTRVGCLTKAEVTRKQNEPEPTDPAADALS